LTVHWCECVEARTNIDIKYADCSGSMIGHTEDGQRQWFVCFYHAMKWFLQYCSCRKWVFAIFNWLSFKLLNLPSKSAAQGFALRIQNPNQPRPFSRLFLTWKSARTAITNQFF
jgi:hypothetical protein